MIAWPVIDTAFLLAAATALIAGMVRGFSGFGTAMIMVPALSALYSPVLAVPIMMVVDNVGTLPLLPGAARRCNWRMVLPMGLAAALFIPAGVWILVTTPERPLAIAIGLIVLALTLVLAVGVRFKRRPTRAMDLGIGATAGLMSGATGMGGPPVVLFWLAGQDVAAQVRADIIVLFALFSIVTLTTIGLNGLFTAQVFGLAIVLLPLFLVGLVAGSRIFGLANERVSRRVALVLIAAVAAASLTGAA